MKKFKLACNRFAFALLGILATVSAYAADGENAIDTSYIDTWVTETAKVIKGWVGQLSPLFMAALGVILALVAWSLFRKVTNKAK